MKKSKFLVMLLIVTMVVLTFAGCGGEADKFTGKWGYIHDAETAVMIFKADKTVTYDGIKYSYTYDDDFLTLTDNGGKITKIRYEEESDKMLIYRIQTYVYQGEGEPDGLVGVWKDEADRWSFEFTDKGEFKEDGYFPGYYAADDESKTIKLMYNDHFEDTYLYYVLEGNTLTVEYPWPMVRVNK